MSELGPRARALIEATRNADDPTAAEAHRLRGSIEARIALGAGTVMASAAVVTTTGSAAAAPTVAVAATAAWVKIAAGVVVACAVATSAGVVAMSSSRGAGATRAASPAAPASPASPVASVRGVTGRGAGIPPLPEATVAAAAPEVGPSAPALSPIAPAGSIPSAVALRSSPASSPTSRPALAASPMAPPAAAPVGLNPAPSPALPAAPAPVALDSALDHEIAILSVARSELREGNPSAALAVLHDAAQRFPNGPLAEDREAETVFALCALGRGAEARAEAARLLAEHPRSPHAAAVRESCGGSNGSPNP